MVKRSKEETTKQIFQFSKDHIKGILMAAEGTDYLLPVDMPNVMGALLIFCLGFLKDAGLPDEDINDILQNAIVGIIVTAQINGFDPNTTPPPFDKSQSSLYSMIGSVQ